MKRAIIALSILIRLGPLVRAQAPADGAGALVTDASKLRARRVRQLSGRKCEEGRPWQARP